MMDAREDTWTDPTPPIKIPARYACPVCEYEAETLADKKRHVRDKHPRGPST